MQETRSEIHLTGLSAVVRTWTLSHETRVMEGFEQRSDMISLECFTGSLGMIFGERQEGGQETMREAKV